MASPLRVINAFRDRSSEDQKISKHGIDVDDIVSDAVDSVFEEVTKSKTASVDLESWKKIFKSLKENIPKKIADSLQKFLSPFFESSSYSDKAKIQSKALEFTSKLRDRISEKIDVKDLFSAFRESPVRFSEEALKTREKIKKDLARALKPLEETSLEEAIQTSKQPTLYSAFKTWTDRVLRAM